MAMNQQQKERMLESSFGAELDRIAAVDIGRLALLLDNRRDQETLRRYGATGLLRLRLLEALAKQGNRER